MDIAIFPLRHEKKNYGRDFIVVSFLLLLFRFLLLPSNFTACFLRLRAKRRPTIECVYEFGNRSYVSIRKRKKYLIGERNRFSPSFPNEGGMNKKAKWEERF